ncbi:deoxycytidine triphosphate deaminase [Halalkalibacter hemicellulosilyticusJCM 9152]|uniref:Deoxycytidine triphosphate deaminase n=1 Tax=Halalkalibacter hemicellulosilyticusJCM 9152 TaxID=1236971 RepID=W4QD35_9BACI|nr:deoxycytidine triphosphate deaminase [Halalkalibacter hemicellulosilyticusJCM 9152]
MILSGKSIQERWEKREISISPFERTSQIQPASVDLRLGNEFKIVDQDQVELLKMDQPSIYKNVEVIRNRIVIPPHSFMLATTLETITLPNHLTAFVEGRSSIGRLGLFIQNAGWSTRDSLVRLRWNCTIRIKCQLRCRLVGEFVNLS